MKSEPEGPDAGIAGEAARLRWLSANGIPCPLALKYSSAAGRDWLLMRALPGLDLARTTPLAPATKVDMIADVLHALHSRANAGCPFDHSVGRRIAAAERRLYAGLVDEMDFHRDRLGRTAADLFEEVRATCPVAEDLVLTHGDACMPNLMCDGVHFSGFVDCGRFGVADRHQDLALAVRSIGYNLGAEWQGRFIASYGRPVDPTRLAFYDLLDEFF